MFVKIKFKYRVKFYSLAVKVENTEKLSITLYVVTFFISPDK